MKISSIYTRRLKKALGRFNVNLSSSELLEIAAAAAGYHNSNEFTAASKRGNLTPPHARLIGQVNLPDGSELVILEDQTAGAPYGIDKSFLEQVVDSDIAEKIGITPYGHLAWLADLNGEPFPNLEKNIAMQPSGLTEAPNEAGQPQIRAHKTETISVHSAVITHKHGTDQFIALSEEGLFSEIAGYCRTYWSEIDLDDPEIENQLDDRAAVETYFENHPFEFVDFFGPTKLHPQHTAQSSLSDGTRYEPKDPQLHRSKYPGGLSIVTDTATTMSIGGEEFMSLHIPFVWLSELPCSFDSKREATEAISSLNRIIKNKVEKLSGKINTIWDVTANSHRLHILLPSDIFEKVGDDNLARAMDYLVNTITNPDSKAVTADFRPQAWVNDYAVDVDPAGETSFDVTFELLCMGFAKAMTLADDHSLRDDLRYAHAAPQWAQDWSGPFEVDVDQDKIDALFNIAR